MTATTTFRPLEWQIPAWQDTSPVILLTGSGGGGKSRLAAEKIHGYLMRYPNSAGLILRKTAEALTSSVLVFMQYQVIGTGNPYVKPEPSKGRFSYSNGSFLFYAGMKDEEQREKVRSIGPRGGLDIVWIEEANKFTEEDFNEVLGRMRGNAASWRQIILSTNPDRPTHWIYQRLILKGGAKVYYSQAADNTYNPKDYQNSLDSLTGLLRSRLRDGLWIQAEGAVYDQFDADVHVIPPFKIPDDWRRIRVVDFGYTNPLVCLWLAIDPDGRVYVYRQYYMTGRIVSDHAKIINAVSKNERFEATVCDHDAEDRATLEREGIKTTAAKKDVTVGIQAVEARLRKAGDGRPRLFVFQNSLIETDKVLEDKKRPVSTEEEFVAYVWPKGSDGKALKEEPLKDNDHAMDALRYGIMYLDNPKSASAVSMQSNFWNGAQNNQTNVKNPPHPPTRSEQPQNNRPFAGGLWGRKNEDADDSRRDNGLWWNKNR